MSVLEFDTEWFGKRIGRRDGDPEETDIWARSEGLDCVFTLLRLNQMSDFHWAVRNGFRLVDVRVEFIARPSLVIPDVRVAEPSDRDAIADIARRSFKRTRFHNDRRFDQERVNEMYANWALTSHGRTYVTEDESGLSGFVVVGETNLELIAVDPAHRGKGHGDALAKAAIGHALMGGRGLLNVVTQGGNHAAQRTFQGVGFTLIDTSLWLHKWYT